MKKTNQSRYCYLFFLLLVYLIFFISTSFAQDKKIYLTNLNHINITYETASDIEKIKELIELKRPKAIYVEQWIIADSKNKNLLKKLRKITSKNKIRLFIVIGKNTWWGERGKANAISAYDLYGKYIDGVVLRVEPNKTNIWKKNEEEPVYNAKAVVLNLLLDAYSVIYLEAKKRHKMFIAEFPFWFTDFQGPNKSFSQNVCDFADKIVFLIDNKERINDFDIPWNKVTCPYNINITKRATGQTEDSINEIYEKLKSTLTFYANFNGYIIDSDSKLLE